MSAVLKEDVTVDEFLVWAEGRPGRYELLHGRIYAMSPQRAVHAVVKMAIATELNRAVKSSGLAWHVMPDGMTVRITDDTAHEPDALVYCGPKVADDVLEIKSPMIVVEVLSPSTRAIDVGTKLPNYFSLPSIKHYLIVAPESSRRLVTQHSRQADGTILTTILRGGSIRLEPPGLELDFESLFTC
jgi:Uma2 family endonuclease